MVPYGIMSRRGPVLETLAFQVVFIFPVFLINYYATRRLMLIEHGMCSC